MLYFELKVPNCNGFVSDQNSLKLKKKMGGFKKSLLVTYHITLYTHQTKIYNCASLQVSESPE